MPTPRPLPKQRPASAPKLTNQSEQGYKDRRVPFVSPVQLIKNIISPPKKKVGK